MKVESIVNLLNTHFQSIKDTSDDWSFFVGLSDYISYINHTPELKNIVAGIEKERENDYQKYYELKKQSWDEMEKSKKQLLKIVNDNEVDNKEVLNICNSIKKSEERKVIELNSIDQHLFNIAKLLVENGHQDLVKQFIDNNREPQNKYGNFVFSKTIAVFRKEVDRIEKILQPTKLWHCWYKLKVIPEVIALTWEEIFSDKINPSDEEIAYYVDFIHIKENYRNMRPNASVNLWPHTKPSVYRNYLQRINTHLIQQLYNTVRPTTTSQYTEERTVEEEKKLKIIDIILRWTKEQHYQEPDNGIVLSPPVKIPHQNIIDEGVNKDEATLLIQSLVKDNYLSIYNESEYTKQQLLSLQSYDGKKDLSSEELMGETIEKGYINLERKEELKKEKAEEIKNYIKKLQEDLATQENEEKKYLFVRPCISLLEKYKATLEVKQPPVRFVETPELKIKGLEERVVSHPDSYKICVKDREIRINEYLIGKPHAVGSNFEFFEYIRSQNSNTKINREALPNVSGSLSLKERVKSKSFIKIVNELGFKGEILKAFFYNRGKDTLTYRGDQIIKEDLENAGVRQLLFLKELETAHTRNSPE